MITLRLTPEQMEKVGREVDLPLERCGGFQRLIIRLQEGLNRRDRTLRLSYNDARKVLHYASESYGPGTYQSQLRAIADDVRRALDEAGDVAQGGLGL